MHDSFYQFYNKIQGEPYENVPPPNQFNIGDYADITNSSIANTEKGNYDLIPLTQDDMKTTARDDFTNWYMKYGKDTTKLGNELNDEEMKRYHGLTQ